MNNPAGLKYPTADGTANQIIKTDGAGNLSIAAQIAGNVVFTPAGGIAATEVQTAIQELDTEKAPLASPTFTGVLVAPRIVTIIPTSLTSAAWNEIANTYTIPNRPTPEFGGSWNQTTNSYVIIKNF
jgi:hypothetical protein